MKNKIFKKIILVVAAASVLVSALVIPSFAYSPEIIHNPPSMTVSVTDNKYAPTSVSYPSADLSLNGVEYSYSYNQYDAESGDYGILYYNLLNTKTFDYSSPGDDSFNPVYKEYYLYADKNVAGNFNNGFNFGNIQFTIEQPFILRSFNIPYSSVFLCLPSATLGEIFSYTVNINYYSPSGEKLSSNIDLNTTVVVDDLGNQGIYLYYLFNNIDQYVPFGSLITDITVIPSTSPDFTYLFNDTYQFVDVYGNLVTQHGVKFIFRYDSSLYYGSSLNGYLNNYIEDLYNNGYDDGLSDGTSNAQIENPFTFIMSTVTSFLSWEFIPGISFSLIASVFVGAILMIILLKKLAGG